MFRLLEKKYFNYKKNIWMEETKKSLKKKET